jgi:XRE family transcriptional regulator, fatty acid utilization regulator
LTASVMLALADRFDLDLSTLMSDTSDRLIADLREALADPVFGDAAPGLMELKTSATNTPAIAHALLRLYEAYRKANERLTSVDDALAREPSGVMQTSYEEVRDFFHYANNYIDPLDRAAEALAAEIGLDAHTQFERLVAYVSETHELQVVFIEDADPAMMRRFDRATRTLAINTRLEPSSQFFQIANQLALMEQTTLIGSILDSAGFKTEEARHICQIGLANYFAGALQMPYGAFLSAAERMRYDIEELAHRFGASLEQVAHRLSTMQRPRERGVPFFFARVDAAGTITKRHSATPLQFARFGGACPLWNVHRAFEEHGRIIRQLAETPDANRYLCLAWSVEKRGGGFRGPVRRYAYALGCEIEHAPRLVYADDLDLGRDAGFEPIGVSCRICERRQCPQRSVPPIAAGITVTPDRREIVPYDIV